MSIKRKKEMEDAESVALKDATDKLLGMYGKNHRFTEADIKEKNILRRLTMV
ncbi:MAG: hypothetical protein HYV59_09500 [Planctomycetes bacterium]|nr:hypothetical protein [Planctomycetota bacterium]